MKGIILSLVTACFAATAAHATHYPPATEHAVKRIVHDGQKLYILHYNGIEVRDKRTGATTCYRHGDGLFPSPTLNAIAVRNDTIWVGSGSGDLTAICGSWSQSWKITFNAGDDKTERPAWLGFNDLKFDSGGRLLFGGDNCVGMMQEPGKFPNVAVPGGLYFGTEIWRMAVDNDGRAWMTASCASMTNCLMSYSPETGFTDGDIGDDANIYKMHTKALAIDADGNKWFGCTSKSPYAPALCRYDGHGIEVHPFTSLSDRHDCPMDMAFDSHGRIWFINDIRWNEDDNGFTSYSKGPLCCFEDGKLTEYEYYEAGMGYSYCIDVDGETVYIGTDSGVLKFDGREFVMVDSEWEYTPTGIRQAAGSSAGRPDIYDLQGRPVADKPQKGMYIKDGKKYVN